MGLGEPTVKGSTVRVESKRLLIDKMEVGGERNTSEEDGLVL